MATSARAASLKAYRTPLKRKVLAVGSLGSSAQSIARKSIDAEFDDMVERYNDGLVSNEEFLGFLQKSYTSPYFTENERVNISDKIRDFQVRVDVERLQTAYQSATGTAKVAAANDIANYYASYAGTLVPGTPAHSQALQKVSDWQTQATQEQTTIERNERKILRYQKLNDVSKMEGNTLEKLQATYDAYVSLAQEAYADGEEAEGLRYETQANDIANTKYPALQKQLGEEGVNTQKKEVRSKFYEIQDAYHDGLISAREAAQLATEIDRVAGDLDDSTLSSQVNTFADKLAKDIESGVDVGNLEGLPTFRRKTKNGDQLLSIKQMRAVFQNEDDVFNQEKMRIMQNPNAYDRAIQLGLLYAAYLYGMAPTDDDPDGWTGLTNRDQVIDQWKELIPENELSYENSKRDELTKQMRVENDFQVITAQLQAISGDVLINGRPASEIIQEILGGVPAGTIVPPGMGNQYGVMVGYDAAGRPYEKLVRLNAQTSEVDPTTGATINQGTVIGKDIARTPDGKYIKLQPHYSSAVAQQNQVSDFSYGEYNGQLYVTDVSGNLVPASEASLKNDAVATWYEGQKATEAERMKAYQDYTFIGPKKPDLQPQTTELATPSAEIKPVITPQEQFDITKNIQPQELYNLPKTTPTSSGRGMGFVDLFSPSQDTSLSNYNLDIPSRYLTPSYEIPQYTQYQDLPNYDSLYNAAPAQNNLQTSGIKLDLGLPALNTNDIVSQLPPTQSPTQNKPGILQQIGTGVSNFLKKINPFD